MQWITENWLLLALIGGMLAMHMFGHGHGRHGRKGQESEQADGEKTSSSDKTDAGGRVYKSKRSDN